MDRTHLVNNGLDLIPTLCDYAGMDPPADLPGRTLRPLLEGPQPANWRKTLYAESQIGYMVTDGRYKYCAYDADKGPRRESLVDLEADPGEMNNLAGDSSKQSIVKRLRIVMAGWHERNGIRFAMPS